VEEVLMFVTSRLGLHRYLRPTTTLRLRSQIPSKNCSVFSLSRVAAMSTSHGESAVRPEPDKVLQGKALSCLIVDILVYPFCHRYRFVRPRYPHHLRPCVRDGPTLLDRYHWLRSRSLEIPRMFSPARACCRGNCSSQRYVDHHIVYELNTNFSLVKALVFPELTMC
jgi:hypothetical protein